MADTINETLCLILATLEGKPAEHLVVHFLWKTGARAEKVISTKWTDTNFHDKHIRMAMFLRKAGRRQGGRKPIRQHERIIPVDDEFLKELLLWKQVIDQGYRKPKAKDLKNV